MLLPTYPITYTYIYTVTSKEIAIFISETKGYLLYLTNIYCNSLLLFHHAFRWQPEMVTLPWYASWQEAANDGCQMQNNDHKVNRPWHCSILH